MNPTRCPICQTEYLETETLTCLACGWDLSQPPANLPPNALAAWYRARESRLKEWGRVLWGNRAIETELRTIHAYLKRARQERGKLYTELRLLQQEVAQVSAQSGFLNGPMVILTQLQQQIENLESQVRSLHGQVAPGSGWIGSAATNGSPIDQTATINQPFGHGLTASDHLVDTDAGGTLASPKPSIAASGSTHLGANHTGNSDTGGSDTGHDDTWHADQPVTHLLKPSETTDLMAPLADEELFNAAPMQPDLLAVWPPQANDLDATQIQWGAPPVKTAKPATASSTGNTGTINFAGGMTPSGSSEATTGQPTTQYYYNRLKEMLAAGRWLDADRATTQLMLEVAGREASSWLRVEDIEKFPTHDLREIDRLWSTYSKGHFGFITQNRLWQNILRETASPVEAWCRFGNRLGWTNNKPLVFSLSAPAGHLPYCSSVGIWWSSGLFPRVIRTFAPNEVP